MKFSFFGSAIPAKNLTNNAIIRIKFIIIIKAISNLMHQQKILLVFSLKLVELIIRIFNNKSISTMLVLLNLVIWRYFAFNNI